MNFSDYVILVLSVVSILTSYAAVYHAGKAIAYAEQARLHADICKAITKGNVK